MLFVEQIVSRLKFMLQRTNVQLIHYIIKLYLIHYIIKLGCIETFCVVV
nr:MAG TPA: hypothetical protein [Crassvirales sp.]